jgi:Uma2 family endonuclease
VTVQILEPKVTRWFFSTADYHRMQEIGIFSEDDRIELIDGEVRVMSPIGARHVAIVNRFNALLTSQIGRIAIVSVQNPIQLSNNTEPQPDLVVLLARDDFYANALPTAADVLLVIEVSDSTLVYDQQEKLPRYAQAGIPEVWLTDADNQAVERYAEPNSNQYATKQTFRRGQSVGIPGLPQVTINVDEIFG